MTIRGFRLGSLAQDITTGLKALWAAQDPGYYMTFQSPVGTYYQVPAGKKFIITRIMFHGQATNTQIRIGYGDNAVSGGTAPTNAVYLVKDLAGPTAFFEYTIDCFFVVPENKYPFHKAESNTSYVNIFGVEIDA